MSATATLNHLPTVAVSRRLCTSPHHRGPRWLPIVYFHVAEWADESKTIPRRIQAHCKTCQNENQRLSKGHKPRGESTTGYKRRTKAEQERYRAYKRTKYAEMTPEQREDRKEYWRIHAEAKRREAGIKPRQFKKRQVSVGSLTRERPQPDEPVLDANPLAVFLEELVHRHGRTTVAKQGSIGLPQLDSILDGTEATVRLELADRILTGIGYPEQLAILYPQED